MPSLGITVRISAGIPAGVHVKGTQALDELGSHGSQFQHQPRRVALVGSSTTLKQLLPTRLVCCSAGDMMSGLPVAPPQDGAVDMRITPD